MSESVRSIPEKKIETRLLIDRLSKMAEGEVVSYEALSVVAGGDVRGSLYGNLLSARNRVERDMGFVFAAVAGEGIKRLNDREKLQVTRSATEHVRKSTGKALRRSATVDISKLTDDEKREHFTRSSQLGVLNLMAGQKAVAQIETVVNKNHALANPRDAAKAIIDALG